MKRLLSLMLVMFFSVLIFTGCGNSKNSSDSQIYGESAEINIAVLGSSEQFAVREEFFVGMDLAIEELSKEGVNLSYETVDDGSSSDSGVALAKDVAKDDRYTLAFTLQTNEVVDSVAAIFEEAKKPLIIVNECFDSTMSKGYEYIFAGVISAEDGGNAIAKYCIDNGVKWAAAAHSGTQYETTFARGFNNIATSSKLTHLVDSVTGPFRKSEFLEVWDRWQTLGVSAAVITFDDIEWACELVQMIREQDPNMLILGDAKFNDFEKITQFPELEGVIVAGSYGVDSNERVQAFYDMYEKRMMAERGIDITTVTAQGYDFVHMIAQKARESSNTQDFIKNMKSSEGYEGVTGVKFKANGQLNKATTYWIIKDGQMHRMNK